MTRAFNSTLNVGKGFKPRKVGLKRTALKRGTVRLKRSAKKKISKADLWRQYGLERPSKPRYNGLKGIYWRLLSEKRRREDFIKYKGECIDQCGKYARDWQDFDAGHFMAAGPSGFDLLFDPVNVNGQLKGCNNPTFSPNAGHGYARGLDKRYGPGTADALYERYCDSAFRGKTTKEWSQIEYDRNIRALLRELKIINGAEDFANHFERVMKDLS